MALLFGICGAFAGIGVAMIASGEGSFAAWAVLSLFGFGTLVVGWILGRGGRTLKLDVDGFEASIGLPWRRPIRVAWRDITRFTSIHVAGQTIVGFYLRPGVPPMTSRLRRLLDDAILADPPDGTLPTVYGGMSAPEMIRYLERWRGRATSAAV